MKEDDPGEKTEEFWKDAWPELFEAIENGTLELEDEFHPIKGDDNKSVDDYH